MVKCQWIGLIMHKFVDFFMANEFDKENSTNNWRNCRMIKWNCFEKIGKDELDLTMIFELVSKLVIEYF